MIYLTNIQITPGSGLYRFKLLTPEDFNKILKDALNTQELDNRIAAAEPLEIINEFTQLKIPLCPLAKASGNIELKTGDAFISCGIVRDRKVIDQSKPPETSGNVEEVIKIQAIQGTFYGDDAEGMVTCVINAQELSGEDRDDWYFKFRDEMSKRVKMKHIRIAETTKPEEA